MMYLTMTAIAFIFVVAGIYNCESVEDVLVVDTLVLIALVISNASFLNA